jgi:chemotaxis protein MotA
MKFLIGIAVVIGCVLSGYLGGGGHFEVLVQPFEFLIIMGAATGAFIIANPPYVMKHVMGCLSRVMSGPRYQKKDYSELLTLLYVIFKMLKTRGVLAIEQHVDNPHESSIFSRFPDFLNNHKALEFLCDYLRLLSMGSENANQMEELIQSELDVMEHEDHVLVNAFEKIADGMPALGIVAAVLGVIHTMGAISQPPEILGKLIGGALVGTFLGVLISYGFIAPIAQSLKGYLEADQRYFLCIKTALISYLNGYAPIIVVEYARKALDEEYRPSFVELEELTNNTADA